MHLDTGAELARKVSRRISIAYRRKESGMLQKKNKEKVNAVAKE